MKKLFLYLLLPVFMILVVFTSCKKDGMTLMEQKLEGVWLLEHVKEQGSFLGKKDITDQYTPGSLELLQGEVAKANFKGIEYEGVWSVSTENVYQGDDTYQTEYHLLISLHNSQKHLLIDGTYSLWNQKLSITDNSSRPVLYFKFNK